MVVLLAASISARRSSAVEERQPPSMMKIELLLNTEKRELRVSPLRYEQLIEQAVHIYVANLAGKWIHASCIGQLN